VFEPLDDLYFKWLCAKVPRKSPSNYIDLFRILHSTEFVSVVARDENRAMDGLDLRLAFSRETGLSPDPEWDYIGCSVFEMLIAFSERIAFQTNAPKDMWFWTFLVNLKLDEYAHVQEEDLDTIANILDVFIWRQYKRTGDGGGLFPLRKSKQDQRDVELWYQYSAYLVDQGLM